MPRRRRMGPREDAELRRMRAQGLSYLDISIEMDISDAVIARRGRELGLGNPEPRAFVRRNGVSVTPWTDAGLARVAEVVALGLSSAAIGRVLGRTKNSVLQAMRRLGVVSAHSNHGGGRRRRG